MSEPNTEPDADVTDDELSGAQSVFVRFSGRFGPRAATKYLTKGLTYPQALEAHISLMSRRVAKAKMENAALKNELAETRANMKLMATGEKTPLKCSPFSGQYRPTSLADVIRRDNPS